MAHPLTPTERRIAEAVADGVTSHKELATRYGVSVTSIRNRLEDLYAKLNVPNKTALGVLVARAQRDGLWERVAGGGDIRPSGKVELSGRHGGRRYRVTIEDIGAA